MAIIIWYYIFKSKTKHVYYITATDTYLNKYFLSIFYLSYSSKKLEKEEGIKFATKFSSKLIAVFLCYLLNKNAEGIDYRVTKTERRYCK